MTGFHHIELAALGAVVATLAISACGSGGGTNPLQSGLPQTGSTASTPSPPPPGVAPCPNPPPPAFEGTCNANGTTVTYVNRGGTLQLSQLTAHVTNVRTTKTLSAPYEAPAVANGMFVVVTLDVANKLDQSQGFDQVGSTQPQTALSLLGATYDEVFEAENGRDQNSFVWKQENSKIQPGETVTGDVVFDVPPDRAAQVESQPHSGLVVLNFSDVPSVRQGQKPPVVGAIRLGS